MLGALECLVGWDLTSNSGLKKLHDEPMWTPGSRISADSNTAPGWQIAEYGYWRHQRSAS
jgi:hypothetical protein